MDKNEVFKVTPQPGDFEHLTKKTKQNKTKYPKILKTQIHKFQYEKREERHKCGIKMITKVQEFHLYSSFCLSLHSGRDFNQKQLLT